MANASLGEPLDLRHGVVLYSTQTVYGTAVTPATSCGIVTAGVQKGASIGRYRGPGSPNILARKAGLATSDWSLSLPAVQSGQKTLIQKAVRVSGALPILTLAIGYQDDVPTTPNRDAEQIRDCKVNTLELSLDQGDGHNPLTGSMSGYGGLVTNPTTLAPLTLSSTPWVGFEVISTKNGSAFELLTMSLSVTHNLSRDTVIRGAAPADFQRGHTYLTEHAEDITYSLTAFKKFGHNPHATVISSTDDLIFVFTNVNDAATLTLTLTDVDYDGEDQEQSDSGIRWSTGGTAASWSLT